MGARIPWTINKDLLIYKSFYFFYFGALGTINPFLPVYFRQIGLSAFAVGLLVGIRPIIQLASAPFWTVVADKFRKRKSILVMSILAWLIMTISLVFVEPTEEICELRATNDSHSIFVNYTKLNTGFFKRSTSAERWRTGSIARVTREVTRSRSNANVRAGGEKLGNFRDNIQSKFQTTAQSPKELFNGHYSFPAYLHKRRLMSKQGQRKETTNRQLQPKQRAQKKTISAPKDSRKKTSVRTTERVLSRVQTHRNEYQHDNLSSKASIISTKQSHKRPTNEKSFAEKDVIVATPITDPSYSNETTFSMDISSETGNKQTEAFDPFNMNGKGQTTSVELATFFAKSQNTSTDINKPTDVRYYNMNGVQEQKKQDNSKWNSTQIPASNVILKNSTISDLKNRSSSNVKHKSGIFWKKAVKSSKITNTNPASRNKTHTLTQINLFKTNRNEMKRLFVILLVLIVVGEFLETPSSPLSDASLLEYLGEGRIHYGKQRLWGSLGHGISSFLVGTLLERSRHLTCGEEFIDYTVCFCVFAPLMFITLVITANFKFKYKDVEETNNGVLSTVLTIHYVSFLFGACYMGMCHGLLHNFLMWFLEDLGGSKTLMGLAICSRCSADLITFFVASKIIETLGQIKIVFVALISYGTIFIAYSNMSNPWFALAVEFLEGFTYAASWSACTSYLAEAAPLESVATMQGKTTILKKIFRNMHIDYWLVFI